MSRQNLTKLSEKHFQLARLLVGGHSQSEAARMLGLHKSTVSRLVRDPLVIDKIKKLQEMADINAASCVPGIPDRLQNGAHRSVDALMDILDDERTDSDIMKIKANVALEILGRAGYGVFKQVKVESMSTNQYLTSEDIEEIKRRAKHEYKVTRS